MWKELVVCSTLFVLLLSPSRELRAQLAPECCSTCSCTLCGELAGCKAYEDTPAPGSAPPSEECSQFEGQGCGVSATPCNEWYDNSQYTGTTVDSYSSTSGTNPCIPIDGGLGFLIAGGLSLGVIGIRRRRDEAEAK